MEKDKTKNFEKSPEYIRLSICGLSTPEATLNTLWLQIVEPNGDFFLLPGHCAITSLLEPGPNLIAGLSDGSTRVFNIEKGGTITLDTNHAQLIIW